MTSEVGGSKHVDDDARYGNVAERGPEVHALDGVCANGPQGGEQQQQPAEAERARDDRMRDVDVAVECQLRVVLQPTDCFRVGQRHRHLTPFTARHSWHTQMSKNYTEKSSF